LGQELALHDEMRLASLLVDPSAAPAALKFVYMTRGRFRLQLRDQASNQSSFLD
jgi:hypothetical protein